MFVTSPPCCCEQRCHEPCLQQKCIFLQTTTDFLEEKKCVSCCDVATGGASVWWRLCNRSRYLYFVNRCRVTWLLLPPVLCKSLVLTWRRASSYNFWFVIFTPSGSYCSDTSRGSPVRRFAQSPWRRTTTSAIIFKLRWFPLYLLVNVQTVV